MTDTEIVKHIFDKYEKHHPDYVYAKLDDIVAEVIELTKDQVVESYLTDTKPAECSGFHQQRGNRGPFC